MAGYKKMPQIDVKGVERDMLDAMDDIISQGKQKLTGIADTWNHKPHWKQEKARVVGNNAVAKVTTGDLPFYMLDGGTTERFATMSRDFLAKTKVGSFTSESGRGGLVYVTKKQPRPGIAARKWTELLSKSSEMALRDFLARMASGVRRPKISSARIRIYNK